MAYYIYIINNIINNKVYIGQTNNPSLRWSQHKSNAKYNRGSQVITRAMSKYGIDSFTFKVIESCTCQQDVDKLEEAIISQYDSCNPEKGYNIDAGGNTTPRTPDILKKISDSLKKHYAENTNHMKGKKLPKQWKINISKASFGKPGTNSGKKFDDNWRLKISKSKVGKQIKNNRRFSEDVEKEICKLYLEENRSTYFLGKKFNCNRSLIADILQRNNVPQRDSKYRKHINKKNIFSLDQEIEICHLYLTGSFSRSDLAKKFNCSKTTIRSVILRHNILT